jgi:hypothetical protein
VVVDSTVEADLVEVDSMAAVALVAADSMVADSMVVALVAADSMAVDSMAAALVAVDSMARHLLCDLASASILASRRGDLLTQHFGRVSIQVLSSDLLSAEVSDLAMYGRLDHRSLFHRSSVSVFLSFPMLLPCRSTHSPFIQRRPI